MRNRLAEEDITHTLNIELKDCDSYLSKNDYLAALIKIQFALCRINTIPSKQEKATKTLVAKILERAIHLVSKLEKEHAIILAEQAFDTAKTWVDFTEQDALWENLTELALYKGCEASAAFMSDQAFLTPSSIQKNYQEAFCAYQISAERVAHSEANIAPQLKELEKLRENANMLFEEFTDSLPNNAAEQKDHNKSYAALKTCTANFIEYARRLAALLPEVREARIRNLLPCDQAKQLESELHKVHQQHKKLSALMKIIEATPSTQIINIYQSLQKVISTLEKAHQTFKNLNGLISKTCQQETEKIHDLILTFQQTINYYNLALWLMPVSDKRYDEVLNAIDKLITFFIYQLCADHWEMQLTTAITKFSSEEIEAILQRISPYLERLEAHGLFNYVTQFYDTVLITLSKTLDAADNLLITETLQPIQSNLYAKINAIYAREANWHEAKNHLQSPLLPRHSLGAWQTGRDVLEAKRRPAVDKKNVEHIITTQARYAEGFKQVVSLIAEELEQILGTAPAYCIATVGSLSRGDCVPRSDFEYSLLVEKKDKANLAYMARWQHLFFLYFTALGENSCSSKEIFPVGFHIDWGINSWLTPGLWETPTRMADFFDPHKETARNAEGRLYYSLLNPVYVHGDERLLQDYRDRISLRLAEPDIQTRRPMYQQRALERIEQHARDYQHLAAQPPSDFIDIKSRYIQLLTFMVMDIGLYYQVTHTHPIRVMEALAKRHLVSESYKNIFIRLFAELTSVRIQLHLTHRHQCDWIAVNTLPHRIKQALQDADDLFLQPFCKAQEKVCKRLNGESLSELNPENDDMKALLQETHWLFLIEAVSTEIKDTVVRPGTVEIEGIYTAKRNLRETVRKQLLHPTTGDFSEEKAKHFNLSGKRRVIPIKRYGQIIAYAKPYPELPGYERTVNLLADSICPEGTARNELFQFTVNLWNATQTSYPVLLSQAVEGDLLKTILTQNQKDRLADLHPYYFAQFFLWTLFTNPEDHKEDNLALVPLTNETDKSLNNPATGRPWLRLVSFDSDHAFATPLKQHSRVDQLRSSFGKIEVNANVKTYVYCHDLMQQPLSQEAAQAFLAIDFNTMLIQCLNELDHYNHRCFDLFTDVRLKNLYTCRTEQQRSFLLSGLGELGVQKLYGKIFLTKILLSDALAKQKKDPTRTLPTPQQLLTHVIPLLAERYEQACSENETLLSRFNHIGKHAYVNIYKNPSPRHASAEETMPERQSQFSLPQTLSTMQIGTSEDYKAVEEMILAQRNYVAQHDIQAFENLSNQRRDLHALREKFYSTNVPVREKLALCKMLTDFVPSLKIEFLNGTALNPGLDFKRLDKPLQEPILKALSGTDFPKLRLRHCHALTLPILKKLIPLQRSGINTTLQTLDISDCVQLGDDAIQFIATTCVALEKLNISRLPKLTFLCLWEVNYFSKGTFANRTPRHLVFENLERLIVIDCSKLQKLWISTPLLQTLVLSRCQNLKELKIPEGEYVCDLSGWDSLTNEELETLMAGCPSVTRLNLTDCVNVGDAKIKAVAPQSIRDLKALFSKYKEIETVGIISAGDNFVGKAACISCFINRYRIDREISHKSKVSYKEFVFDKNTFRAELWSDFGIRIEKTVVDIPRRTMRISPPEWHFMGDVFILMFDVTNFNSYESIKKWAKELGMTKPTLLVGNKTDQFLERKISYGEGMALQKEIGALAYLECSAMTGEGIDEVYLTAISLGLLKRYSDAAIAQTFIETYPDFETGITDKIVKPEIDLAELDKIKKLLKVFLNPISSPVKIIKKKKNYFDLLDNINLRLRFEKEHTPTDNSSSLLNNKLIHKFIIEIQTLLQKIYPMGLRPELSQKDFDYILSVETLLEDARQFSNEEQLKTNLRLLQEQKQTLQDIRVHKLAAQFCVLNLLATAAIRIKQETTRLSESKKLPWADDLAAIAGRIVNEAFPPTVISASEVWHEEESAAGFLFSPEQGILQSYFASRSGFWSAVKLLEAQNADPDEQLSQHQFREMV